MLPTDNFWLAPRPKVQPGVSVHNLSQFGPIRGGKARLMLVLRQAPAETSLDAILIDRKRGFPV